MTTEYTPKALGIYVHIPFCKSKCQYCDFYSLGGSRDRKLVDDYLQALATHIKETGALAPGYIVDSVYFGGGTPSFFGADNLRRIYNEIQRRFKIARDVELTFEANPDSVNEQGLRQLKREGFNRVSLGVQSDDDEMLKKLGRPHNYAQVKQAVAAIRKVGFKNLSLDLMFGLPSQTLTQWEDTLRRVLLLQPEHLSCYALKVEEGTPLWDYREYANLPDADLQADMYLKAVEILKEAGYRQYEISNFARPGFESRHNMKYWTGEEYLGFGPAAASDFAGKRFTAKADINTYVRAVLKQDVPLLAECEAVPLRERAGEYLMLRLRTTRGIARTEYEKNYLLPFDPIEERLKPLAEEDLCQTDGTRWRLTPKGFLVSNRILVDLLEAQETSEPLAKRR